MVSSAPPERGGSAAALSSISGDLGVALGSAALGSVGSAVYRSQVQVPEGLPEEAARATGDSLESTMVAAGRLSPELGDQALAAARDAYTSGLNIVAVVCALVAATTAVIAMTALRGVGSPKAGPAQDAPQDVRPPVAP
ncbi:hypothetical protein ACIQRW_23420 [Streptomyces sp. NPDC091287]|uniref:hypothetical protein n=1 Tax=Streptomyces sp. NPDC091287 TaxID=3365988 RepID=UPI003804D5F3